MFDYIESIGNKSNKKWQVTYIAPLQPSILAAFLPWGISTGAGRIRLADAKVSLFFIQQKNFYQVFITSFSKVGGIIKDFL